ncbi:MAG TPA: MarR family transcriptional regulator [Thermomicrobiales bacterium]|nr:MarR family transcriptional regulator [Thermomicrobiales bacterium]
MADEARLADEDPLIQQVIDLLPSIGKLLSMTVAHYPGATGRSLAQIKMLTHLHHHGPCTVGELAVASGVSMSAASEVADRLVEDGMITRGTNPDDRRQVLLTPTEDAIRLGAEIRAMRSRHVRSALDRLDPVHRPAVVPVLQALSDALHEETAVEGCPAAGRVAR